MMFGDINDAGKRIQTLIDQQIDPGSAEVRALIASMDTFVKQLSALVDDLRAGRDVRISLGEKRHQ